ncbi:MAG TPA: M24 family metallopeptidase, partial [Solirubrobacteraceae bacterium]|nr:M24 family metallopeptidase [Solirubrobacteraceae bacterium]
ELTTSDELFSGRRRRKSEAELAGMRRAAGAAVAAFELAAAMLRDARIDGEQLRDGDGVLTSERVRERIREICARAGAPAPPDVIVVTAGPDPPGGHEAGSGPLRAHVPVVIDLWPQDELSGCWADMTRTFVRGDVSDAVGALHELVLDAHRRALAAVKPGILGVELYGVACDPIEAAGYPTQRTKAPGESLDRGFYFALGHGVGLEVHEAPYLGLLGRDALVEGDVVAVEPGVIVPGLGESRLEDLVLVGPAGGENLTGSFPYGLAP